jgi:hypothetical protein
VANASFDAQFLNIPIRSLVINDGVFPVVVREAKIRRGYSAHDSAELSVLIQGEMTFDGRVRVAASGTSGTTDVRVESLVGQPVLFTYGVAPMIETFYGYILSVNPDQKFKQSLNYVITLVGATAVMQSLNRRFYTNVTDGELVQRLADRGSLGFSSNTSTVYRWPSIGVTSQTDWELAVALSERSACLLFNWGGVLRMDDPRRLFRDFPFTTLVVSDDLLETDRRLLDFKPVSQSEYQITTRPVEFFFFDRSGQVVSYQQPKPGYDGSHTPFGESPVMSREEAELYGAMMNNSIERWLQSATARIKGDASIYPGVTVDVNTGTRSSTAKFNGRWLVLQVSHSMTREAFNTELTLARPGDSIPALSKSTFDPFWRSSTRGRPSLFLRNGLWFSSWSNPNTEVA